MVSTEERIDNKKDVELQNVQIDGEQFFKLNNSNQLRPFFMSIVSASNHWMFISSNGGLTAGRRNAQFALFPYYTDDKITEFAEFTGSKSIFRVAKLGKTYLWEPLSMRQEGRYATTRNLYKSIYGNKVVFEEINHDLGLTFRYQWSNSDQYGFVRKSTLINTNDHELNIQLLDGIQNILPAQVETGLQNDCSNLVDAYKRNERIAGTNLGLYALSAKIVDRAEPSESLKTNLAWSLGFDAPTLLLSSMQLDTFRAGQNVENEYDVKAEKGAYFLSDTITLNSNTSKNWYIIADVNKNHSAVLALVHELKENTSILDAIHKDIEQGSQELTKLVAAADGLQHTNDLKRDIRHFSNTMFNIMRGGIFPFNYSINVEDFTQYLEKANKEVFHRNKKVIDSIPANCSLFQLQAQITNVEDADLKRLCLEYLPLTFSRRHGDPSRPWNIFDINTKNQLDGSIIFDYQGNWRDIFQNWEALGRSYPAFVESMTLKFLNATTFEGYNPYRVTKGGFDWETIEPDNPWAYIGYWGDHQIIYLLKFLEFLDEYNSEILENYFDQDCFVYANVPYKIKSYEEIYKNPKDTIKFDFELDHQIRKNREEIGADGALIHDKKGAIHRVNFIEKILATLLCKMSNLVPEGGIWLNTQRPEWNDANNALVGNGISMVTVYYLRRFISFLQNLLAETSQKEVSISTEFAAYFAQLSEVFKTYEKYTASSFDDKNRKAFMDKAGTAAFAYREQIYNNSFSGDKTKLSLEQIKSFLAIANDFIAHTIKANKKENGLYHAYNLITAQESGGVSLSYLDEMLEGQVAVLSSGMLSADETLQVLHSMKASQLFRPDQYSYILYPNKELPKFLEKNNISKIDVEASSLLSQLVADGNLEIIEKDINGDFHFNGDFHNAFDLENALDKLKNPSYQQLLQKEKKGILQLFEKVFQHKKFTGRSGTFFGYEGLGSIYWHMVSKLLLAVQECSVKAIKDQKSAAVIGGLLDHFYEINAGIGVHKPPSLYGAFPTDPYSHTPGGKGAQQPGMTGQVKEDILSRFGELGIFVNNKKIVFNPCLLRKEEFLATAKKVEYWSLDNTISSIDLAAGSLFFTVCQVPVVYSIGEKDSLTTYSKEGSHTQDSLTLDEMTSKSIFERTGKIERIEVQINPALLK